ncbi:MAG: WD40/YVTN/BNR-like repeat-containing protein, partial [Candidatus Binatia bacterium]
MLKSLRVSCALSCAALLVVTLATAISAQRRQPTPATASTQTPADTLKVLQWRSIGPFRGGRSAAVAGVVSQPMVYYFGGTGGGVWKTTDGGINWEPISDGPVFGTGSVGAIGLSDSDPNTIYVGMGESPI